MLMLIQTWALLFVAQLPLKFPISCILIVLEVTLDSIDFTSSKCLALADMLPSLYKAAVTAASLNNGYFPLLSISNNVPTEAAARAQATRASRRAQSRQLAQGDRKARGVHAW